MKNLKQLAEVRYEWKHIQEWCDVTGISVLTWCEQLGQQAFDSYLDWKQAKIAEAKTNL